MRKGLVGFIAFSLLLVPTQFLNAASVKAGASCTKLGQSQIINDYRFTCIKSGKKLVWNKGVAITKPIPTISPSPLPSPTPKPTPTPIPIPTPLPSPNSSSFVEPTPPSNFQDLEQHIDAIPYWAWKKTRDELNAGIPNLGNITVLIGPNTQPTQPDLKTWLEIASKLYGSFNQVKNLTVIEFAYSDIAWAESQYQLLQDQSWRSDYLTKASHQCPDQRCRSAEAELNSKGDGIIMIGSIALSDQPKDKVENPGRYNGTQQTHEYIHTIQVVNTPNFTYAMLPQWLQEGLAMGIAQALSANSYKEYLDLRKIDYPELISMKPSYTAEWISNFLNPHPIFEKNADNWAYWRQFPNYRIYDIGALTNEILTSLKGPSAVMNLYVSVGKGSTFEQAFKDIFGLSWSDANTFIAKAISLELIKMHQ